MKFNPSNNKFWIEINNLKENENYWYQYEVFAKSPVSDSPTVIKVADPFSNVILSSYDDSEIPENSYPNLPIFPNNQKGEFTFVNQSKTYNWNVIDFKKPNKEDLIIYEILIRDFDKERTFQNSGFIGQGNYT